MPSFSEHSRKTDPTPPPKDTLTIATSVPNQLAKSRSRGPPQLPPRPPTHRHKPARTAPRALPCKAPSQRQSRVECLHPSALQFAPSPLPPLPAALSTKPELRPVPAPHDSKPKSLRPPHQSSAPHRPRSARP